MRQAFCDALNDRYFLLFYDCCYQSDLIAWKWLLIVVASKLEIFKYQIPWTMKHAKWIQNWKLLVSMTCFIWLIITAACWYVVPFSFTFLLAIFF